MTINYDEIEYIPTDLEGSLPENIASTPAEFAAMENTTRVLVKAAGEGEGWAVGTIWIRRYIEDQEVAVQTLRYDPPSA